MKLEDLDKVIELRDALLSEHGNMNLIGASIRMRVEYRDLNSNDGLPIFELDANEMVERELFRALWQISMDHQREVIKRIERKLHELGVRL